MSRFIDAKFDNKKLPPICGYWSEKLVSLEETLKPIMPLVEQLERSIKAAKKYCHFPSEHGLTRDESAALYLYTMEGGDNSFYRVLNEALRSEDRSALKIWFCYLKLLDTALSKLPTVRRNVWRGVIGDIGKNLVKNQELTWWTVTSCSLSVDVVKEFLASETRSTLFLIEAINGKYVSGYTNYPNEDEVLLPPGTRLLVVANVFDHPGGLNVVHLVEVNDDNDQQLPSPMAAMSSNLPRLGDQEAFRMEQLTAASTLSSTIPAIKNKSLSRTEQRHKYDLPCGGRRCPTCGHCCDWKLIEGGNWMRYSDWKRVSDPDATCHYSHVRHALLVRSWNCKCKK